MSDLRESKVKVRGFIAKTPHYNSIFNYLENPALTPILTDLIIESSLPLKALGVDFAVDSSGFSTSRFEHWFDHNYGADKFERDWVKTHIMCGVKTNVVTAVEIHDKSSADCPLLPPVVRTTAQNFHLNEVSADRGYVSNRNFNVIRRAHATPFIAFKSNSRAGGGNVWREMYYYFQYRRDEFLQHYHKRSNVETTFSMIKRKFGDSVRSKTDVAMKNEVLCKVLCHNIVVLIHETLELGIEPIFWQKNACPICRRLRHLLDKARGW